LRPRASTQSLVGRLSASLAFALRPAVQSSPDRGGPSLGVNNASTAWAECAAGILTTGPNEACGSLCAEAVTSLWGAANGTREAWEARSTPAQRAAAASGLSAVPGGVAVNPLGGRSAGAAPLRIRLAAPRLGSPCLAVLAARPSGSGGGALPAACLGRDAPPALALLPVLARRLAESPWLARRVDLVVASSAAGTDDAPLAELELRSEWGREPLSVQAWSSSGRTDLDVAMVAWGAAQGASALSAEWSPVPPATGEGVGFGAAEALARALAGGAAAVLPARRTGDGGFAHGMLAASLGSDAEDGAADGVGIGTTHRRVRRSAGGGWTLETGAVEGSGEPSTRCDVTIAPGADVAGSALVAALRSTLGSAAETAAAAVAGSADAWQSQHSVVGRAASGRCRQGRQRSLTGVSATALAVAAGQFVRQVGSLPHRPHAAMRRFATSSALPGSAPLIFSSDEARAASLPAWAGILAAAAASLAALGPVLLRRPAAGRASSCDAAASLACAGLPLVAGVAVLGGAAGWAVLAATPGLDVAAAAMWRRQGPLDVSGPLPAAAAHGLQWLASGASSPWWSPADVDAALPLLHATTAGSPPHWGAASGWAALPTPAGAAVSLALVAVVGVTHLLAGAAEGGAEVLAGGAVSPGSGLLAGALAVGARAGCLSRWLRAVDGVLAAAAAAEESCVVPDAACPAARVPRCGSRLQGGEAEVVVWGGDEAPGSLFGRAGAALAAGPIAVAVAASSTAAASLGQEAATAFLDEAAGRAAMGVWAPSVSSGEVKAGGSALGRRGAGSGRAGRWVADEEEDEADSRAVEEAMAAAFLGGLGLSSEGVGMPAAQEPTGGKGDEGRGRAGGGDDGGATLLDLMQEPMGLPSEAEAAVADADAADAADAEEEGAGGDRSTAAVGSSAPPAVADVDRPDPDAVLARLLPAATPPAALSGAVSDASALPDAPAAGREPALGAAAALYGVILPVLPLRTGGAVAVWLDGVALALWQLACAAAEAPVSAAWPKDVGTVLRLTEAEAIAGLQSRQPDHGADALHRADVPSGALPSPATLRDRAAASLSVSAVAVLALAVGPAAWAGLNHPLASPLWGACLGALAVGAAGAAVLHASAASLCADIAAGVTTTRARGSAAVVCSSAAALLPLLLTAGAAHVAGSGCGPEATAGAVPTLWRGAWLLWAFVKEAVAASAAAAASRGADSFASLTLGTLLFAVLPLVALWAALLASAAALTVRAAARAACSRPSAPHTAAA